MKTYPFGSGRPDPASLPSRALADAAARVVPELGDELARYPGSLGYEPMRQVMAERFERREGAALPIERTALTTGSMQAVTLMAQYFVEKPGDVILTEEFTYSGTIGAYNREGATLVGVEIDEHGMKMDSLVEKIKACTKEGNKPRFIYALVTYQNPTGSIMPVERRRELLDIAHRYDIPVVEDHCYADTIYDDHHVPALITLGSDATVLHIESFSKILGPGVRLGCFTGPNPVFSEILSPGRSVCLGQASGRDRRCDLRAGGRVQRDRLRDWQGVPRLPRGCTLFAACVWLCLPGRDPGGDTPACGMPERTPRLK